MASPSDVHLLQKSLALPRPSPRLVSEMKLGRAVTSLQDHRAGNMASVRWIMSIKPGSPILLSGVRVKILEPPPQELWNANARGMDFVPQIHLDQPCGRHL